MNNLSSNIRAVLLGGDRYDIRSPDGHSRGGSLYLATVADGENQAGLIPTKLPCEFELIDSIQGCDFGQEHEIQCRLRKGAKGTTALFAEAVRPVSSGRKSQPASSAAQAQAADK